MVSFPEAVGLSSRANIRIWESLKSSNEDSILPYPVLPKNKPVPHLELPRLLILQNGITLRQKISQHLKPYDVQRI